MERSCLRLRAGGRGIPRLQHRPASRLRRRASSTAADAVRCVAVGPPAVAAGEPRGPGRQGRWASGIKRPRRAFRPFASLGARPLGSRARGGRRSQAVPRVGAASTPSTRASAIAALVAKAVGDSSPSRRGSAKARAEEMPRRRPSQLTPTLARDRLRVSVLATTTTSRFWLRANVEGALRDTTRSLALSPNENALRALEALVGRYPAAAVACRRRYCRAGRATSRSACRRSLLERRPDPGRCRAPGRGGVLPAPRCSEGGAVAADHADRERDVRSRPSLAVVLKDREQSVVQRRRASPLQPIFSGGYLQAQVDARTAEQRAAVVDYGKVSARVFGEKWRAPCRRELAAGEREQDPRGPIRENARALELAGSAVSGRLGRPARRAAAADSRFVCWRRWPCCVVQSERLVQRVNSTHLCARRLGFEVHLAAAPAPRPAPYHLRLPHGGRALPSRRARPRLRSARRRVAPSIESWRARHRALDAALNPQVLIVFRFCRDAGHRADAVQSPGSGGQVRGSEGIKLSCRDCMRRGEPHHVAVAYRCGVPGPHRLIFRVVTRQNEVSCVAKRYFGSGLAAAGLLLSGGRVRRQRNNDRKINVDLTGFEEVPVVITTGNGGLKLTINEAARTIDYVLTFADLQADITQSHIHVAQKSVNGGIVLWLCRTTGHASAPRRSPPLPLLQCRPPETPLAPAP